MGFFDFLLGKKINYTELVRNGATVLDVRTKEEFNRGHSNGAINIPLHEVEMSVSKIKNMDKPLIVVCQSGMRSAQAKKILSKSGIEALNGRSWKNV